MIPLLRRSVPALSTGWLLFLLVPLSSTGLAFPSFLFAFGLTVLFGTLSLVVVLTSRSPSWARVVAWLVHLLAAALLLILFLSSQSPANPLFRLRFYLSCPALEDAARSALSQQPLATPAWIGLFPVRRIDVYPPEVRFISDGCGVVDECGLIYMPGAIPGGRYKTRVKHLEGACLDDVRSHAEFLSRHLADVVIRFMGNRCARPTPVPQPPFFGRLGRGGADDRA